MRNFLGPSTARTLCFENSCSNAPTLEALEVTHGERWTRGNCRTGIRSTKWVCLKIEKTPKANGFADHYPYNKWLAIIGNIPNIFRQTQVTWVYLLAQTWSFLVSNNPYFGDCHWICDHLESAKIHPDPIYCKRIVFRCFHDVSMIFPGQIGDWGLLHETNSSFFFWSIPALAW